MAKAAERMGQAARKAEAVGEVIGRYRGEILNGKPHGLGVTRFQNGSVACEGEWLNGTVHGLCVQRHPNGTICYAGQFQDNRRHGYGVSRSVRRALHHRVPRLS
eukprot:GHVU01068707.1.p3 GENE.GHVU01068707.1~~GHVU01068707.1.p3  ORF type:complete len:114 (+),score=4.59 GHVU01068707.1:31-342(+)